jgi:cytochrome b subunit of formate dehydrogenase
LGITGFYPVLVLKESIHGYWLILHAVFAPVFVICLAGLVVMWAGNCCFNKNDWPWLQKICFWLIVILALPVILSIVLSMFSLFGTQGQEFLLQLHRYSALLLALIAIVYTYLIIRTQMKQ